MCSTGIVFPFVVVKQRKTCDYADVLPFNTEMEVAFGGVSLKLSLYLHHVLFH